MDIPVPPKGTDMLLTNQEELDTIDFELNMRARKRFDFKCPIQVMNELVQSTMKQHPQFNRMLHSEPTSA